MRSKLLPLLAVPLLAIGVFLALRTDQEAAPPAAAASATADAPREAEATAAALRAAADAPAFDSGARSAAAPLPPEARASTASLSAAVSVPTALRQYLRGRIVDAAGSPIPGAAVRLAEPSLPLLQGGAESDGESVLTAGDGRFELPIQLPPAGENARRFGAGPTLSARAAGFAPLRQPVDIPPSGDLDLGDLALGTGLILSGRVVDADGQPVQGAKLFVRTDDGEAVFLFGPNGTSPDAVTEANGVFRFDVLAFAPWLISVEHPSHPDKEFRGGVPEQGRESSGVVLQLDRPASIGGLVRSLPSSGGAYEVRAQRAAGENGFFLGLPERRAAVGAGGRFRLEGLASGESYTLTLGPVPKDPKLGRFDFESMARSLSRPVVALAGSEGVELVYQEGSRLCFQVVDDQSGEPLEQFEAQVRLGFSQESLGDKGQRFEAGRACFEDLRPPEGSQAAFAPPPSLSLRASGYGDLTVPLPPIVVGTPIDLGVVRLRPVPRLTVRVVDDQSGAPVAGARVTLFPDGGAADGSVIIGRTSSSEDEGISTAFTSEVTPQSGTTDSLGSVAFNTFAGQPATLEVEPEGYARLVRTGLELDTEKPSEIELRLLRGGSVRVLVRDSAGQPLPGARVQSRPEPPSSGQAEPVMDPFGDVDSQTSDELGQSLFEHVPAGPHRFWIEPPRPAGDGPMFVFFDGLEQETRGEVIEVAEGELVELVLVAAPEAELRGRILESGSVLAGASVSLRKADGTDQPWMMAGPMARCDGDGRYRLERIEPGEYTAVIRAPSRAGPHEVAVRIEPGENRLDLDLGVAILEGRVLDPEGRPLAGISVKAEVIASASAEGAVFTAGLAGYGGGVSVVSLGGERAEAVTTDAEGRYRLRGVSAGRELRVVAEPGPKLPLAQAARSESLQVGEGETRTVPDLTLELGGELIVKLVGSDGQPVFPAWVIARRDGPQGAGEPRFQPADEQGQVRLTSLEAGRWILSGQRLSQGPTKPVEKEFEVVAGEVREARIELP